MRRRRPRRHEDGMVTVETALSQGPLWLGLILAMVPILAFVELMSANFMSRDLARHIAIHGALVQSQVMRNAAEAADVDVTIDGEFVEVTVTKESPLVLDFLGVEIKGTHRVVMEPQ